MSNAAQNSAPDNSKTGFKWPSQEEIDKSRHLDQWEIKALRKDDPERAWALEFQDWKDQGCLSRDLTNAELEKLCGELCKNGAPPVIETLVVEALARQAVKARAPHKSLARLLETYVGTGSPIHSEADAERIHGKARAELAHLWKAGGDLDWVERYG